MPITLAPPSVAKLTQINPRLATVVLRAASYTDQPFGVAEGLRSQIEQFSDWKKHTSTLNGLHIGQTYGDGTHGTGLSKHQTGDAVDLVPLVRGIYRWEWPLIYPIVAAMLQASLELSVQLRWGGCWDRTLQEAGTTSTQMTPVQTLQTAVSSYVSRHAGPDFLDGPHYELV